MRAELAVFSHEPLSDKVDGFIGSEDIACLDGGFARHACPEGAKIIPASGKHFPDEFSGGGAFQQRRNGPYFENRARTLFAQDEIKAESRQRVAKRFDPFAFGRMESVLQWKDQRLRHAGKTARLDSGNQHPLVGGMLIEDKEGGMTPAVPDIPKEQVRSANLPHIDVRPDADLPFLKSLDVGLPCG